MEKKVLGKNVETRTTLALDINKLKMMRRTGMISDVDYYIKCGEIVERTLKFLDVPNIEIG